MKKFLALMLAMLMALSLVACGSEKVAKEKGLMRSEGKEYVVQDGDIILFRFNV